jgi:hypothetical protein
VIHEKTKTNRVERILVTVISSKRRRRALS